MKKAEADAVVAAFVDRFKALVGTDAGLAALRQRVAERSPELPDLTPEARAELARFVPNLI